MAFPTVEETRESIIEVGNEALEWFYNVIVGSIVGDDEEASEETPVNVGQVVVGNAYYVYQDQNGAQTIIPTTYDFRTNISDGHQIFGGVVTATARTIDSPTGTATPTISVGVAGVGAITYNTWSGGSYYNIDLAIPNAQDTMVACHVTFANDQYKLPMTYTDRNSIYAYGVQKNVTTAYLRAVRDGANDGIGFTTMPSIHNYNKYVPYAPISNKSATYNDTKQYIVDWANDLSEELNLNITFVNADFKDFEDMTESEAESESESESESSGGSDGFHINYNEILSEGELESVLTQETYTVDEIETEIVLQDYTISLPETESETEISEVIQAVSTVPALMSEGFSLLDSWHLSGLFTSLAVISAIWNRILKG